MKRTQFNLKRNSSGFTLIEIAIVLVIIGLLLGGVLKGQELINSAKVKNLALDFKNIPVLIYGYQDKYKSLPGDDPTPASHVGAAATSAAANNRGNGTINGAWDSIIGSDESVLFWQHVRMAGLTTGPTTVSVTSLLDPYFPQNAIGGRLGVQGNLGTAVAPKPIERIPGTYVICSADIPGKFARQLDTTLDDGVTNEGYVRVTAVAAGTAPVPTGQAVQLLTPADDDKLFVVCMGV